MIRIDSNRRDTTYYNNVTSIIKEGVSIESGIYHKAANTVNQSLDKRSEMNQENGMKLKTGSVIDGNSSMMDKNKIKESYHGIEGLYLTGSH